MFYFLNFLEKLFLKLLKTCIKKVIIITNIIINILDKLFILLFKLY